MPGVYLAVIVVSALGVGALDARFRLALFDRPLPVLAATGIGVGFFLVWDLVGIAAGVFVQGDSPLYTGIGLAPHLPLEEPVFLTFLCYLALVVHAASRRVPALRTRLRRAADDSGRTR